MNKVFFTIIILMYNSSFFTSTSYKIVDYDKKHTITFNKFPNPTPVINPFYFEENSFVYCNQEYLEKFQLLMSEYPNIRIELTGHSTNKEFELNPLLSQQRVQNIAHLLKIVGIADDKIKIQDLKNSQPKELTGNDKINRRVELYFTEE